MTTKEIAKSPRKGGSVSSNKTRPTPAHSVERAEPVRAVRANSIAPSPYIGEESPIVQLQGLAQTLINSAGVANDAFAKAGLYALGAQDIADRVSELQDAMCKEIGDSLAGPSSAIASIQLARNIAARFQLFVEAIVEGVDVGTDKIGEEDDREEMAADRTYAGRRVSNEYVSLICLLNNSQRLIDKISISIFGNPAEVDDEKKAAQDSDDIGILYMLKNSIERMEHTRNALDTVVYRINETM